MKLPDPRDHPPLFASVLRSLLAAAGKGMAPVPLADATYKGAKMPPDPIQSVRVAICKRRPQLAEQGWEIVFQAGRYILKMMVPCNEEDFQ